MRTRALSLATAALLAILQSACGQIVGLAGSYPEEDAAVDGANVDSGSGGHDATVTQEAGPSGDGGGDATVDAGNDATVDAGSDATVDSGSDATVDSGVDATVTDSGGIDATVADAGPPTAWVDATVTVLTRPTNADLICRPASGTPDPGDCSLAISGANLYWGNRFDLAIGVVGVDGSVGAPFTMGDQAGDWGGILAADGNGVYAVGNSPFSIIRAGLDGGGVLTLVANPGLPSIAVARSRVYFIDNTSVSDSGSLVECIDEDGGAQTLLAGGFVGQGQAVSGMTTNASNLFWTDGSQVYTMQLDGGGGVRTLANPDPLGSNAFSHAAQHAANSTSVLVLADDLYVNQQLLFLVPQSGAAVSTIASNLPGSIPIATDDNYVYWGANTTDGGGYSSSLWRAPLDGGAALAFPFLFRYIVTLVLDSTSLYLVDEQAGDSILYKVSPR